MTGSGTLLDPYVIYNATDLQNVETNLASHYILNNNIDASATSGWDGGDGFLPIGLGAPFFTGTFDGKGYTISELAIDRGATDNIALFGVIAGGASIINVTLSDVDITGKDYVAALIGVDVAASLVLTNCHSSGVVTGEDRVGGLIAWAGNPVVTDSSSSATVSGFSFLGGFVGYIQNGSFDGCYATGAVTATFGNVGGFVGYFTTGTINRSDAIGNVEAGDDYAGGFAGWSNGDSTNCYARGSVTSTADFVGGFAGQSGQETNCYSTGAVSGVGANIGGFAGIEDTIVDCFWDMDASGQSTSNGGTGKTTSQMKNINTFRTAGWEVLTIWNIVPRCNSGYPCLRGVNPCCTLPSQGSVDSTIIGNKVSLEAIRNLEIVYGGRFYISKSGLAIYESRYHRNV